MKLLRDLIVEWQDKNKKMTLLEKMEKWKKVKLQNGYETFYDVHMLEEALNNSQDKDKKNYDKLKGAGLNQPTIVRRVLDDPELTDKIVKNKESLKLLNDLGLSRYEYIDKLLDNPQNFKKNYDKLKGARLNQPTIVRRLLDDLELTDRVIEHKENLKLLKDHKHLQNIYIDKLQDDPDEFSKKLEEIRDGLEYVKLDKPILDESFSNKSISNEFINLQSILYDPISLTNDIVRKLIKQGLKKAINATGDPNKKIIAAFLIKKLNNSNDSKLAAILKTSIRAMSHHTSRLQFRFYSFGKTTTAYKAAKDDFDKAAKYLKINNVKSILKDRPDKCKDKHFVTYNFLKGKIDKNKSIDMSTNITR